MAVLDPKARKNMRTRSWNTDRADSLIRGHVTLGVCKVHIQREMLSGHICKSRIQRNFLGWEYKLGCQQHMNLKPPE